MEHKLITKIIAISIIIIMLFANMSLAVETIAKNEIDEKEQNAKMQQETEITKQEKTENNEKVQNEETAENKIEIKYEYNESTNQVTATMISTVPLKDTKPSWTLSEDKLTYTKTFGANDDYTTDVEDIYGNVTTVRITITGIKQIEDKTPPVITMEYIENKDNTVTAIMHSNEALKDTKPSWTLSADKLNYTKIFGANDDYTTDVEDMHGNVATVRITITGIKEIEDKTPPVITMEYVENEDNTVTAIMHSNELLANTKPTWTLSKDQLSYSKIFYTNQEYTTPVQDIYGNVATVKIVINQIKNESPFVVTIEYKKNDDNTVTAIMKSNVELKHTKPSWSLSEDKLTYTKTFGANDTYTTDVEDIYGNVTTVKIEITQIDDKGPEIQLEYIHDSINNTVTVTMKSNEILKDTKPSWTLSEDKLSYTKTFGANDIYTTDIEDIYGNVTTVTIEVTQIDDKGPEITLEYIYNADGTTTVIMHSNEVLAHTKPSWTLSEDKLNYTKTFGADDEYATAVEDIYGNVAWVKIRISTKNYQYSNAGFIVTVKYLYDSNEKVTVKLVSNRPLKSTKPSWTLSEDQMVYTRVFTNNDIYTTSVEDIYGNQLTVSILVDFFKNTHRGIDVSEYQKFIDWRTVKNSGIDFAIIRVGYRGYGNGKIVEDRFFDNNIQEATKAGMDIGFYFYSQAISVEEAVQEAQFTLQLLSKYNVPITYPIAIDTERTPNGNGRADGISKELRTEVVRAFCNEIQRAGYKTMIYANKNWLLNDLNITSLNYDVWLAHYTDATDYPYPYTIWQYTSTGSVNGIVGNVDMNIGYKK